MLGSRRLGLAVILVVQAITLAWFGAPKTAMADPLPPTVAAVVDYQRVLQEAAASKSIAQQMEVRRKAYHDEIEQQQQTLLEAEQELAKQRSVLSQDAVNARQQELEGEVQALRDLTEKRRQQLEQVSAEAVSQVEVALFEVLTNLAEERGLNVILPTSQVLFFSRQIDLTDEVLGQLDATLSEVPVTDRVD